MFLAPRVSLKNYRTRMQHRSMTAVSIVTPCIIICKSLGITCVYYDIVVFEHYENTTRPRAPTIRSIKSDRLSRVASYVIL